MTNQYFLSHILILNLSVLSRHLVSKIILLIYLSGCLEQAGLSDLPNSDGYQGHSQRYALAKHRGQYNPSYGPGYMVDSIISL